MIPKIPSSEKVQFNRCTFHLCTCLCLYIGRQLGVGLQSGPDLGLEAAVGENLSDQAEFTGLSGRQLLIKQQHLTGLQKTESEQISLSTSLISPMTPVILSRNFKYLSRAHHFWKGVGGATLSTLTQLTEGGVERGLWCTELLIKDMNTNIYISTDRVMRPDCRGVAVPSLWRRPGQTGPSPWLRLQQLVRSPRQPTALGSRCRPSHTSCREGNQQHNAFQSCTALYYQSDKVRRLLQHVWTTAVAFTDTEQPWINPTSDQLFQGIWHTERPEINFIPLWNSFPSEQQQKLWSIWAAASAVCVIIDQ